MITLAEIEGIVHAHSGGIKFTALMTEIIAHHDLTASPLDIEDLIRSSPFLDILEYRWKMSANVYRAKLFIYTPTP